MFICRLCLQLSPEDTCENISSINNEKLKLVLPEITGLELTSPVCAICVKLLEEAYNFKLCCLQSDKSINEYREKHGNVNLLEIHIANISINEILDERDLVVIDDTGQLVMKTVVDELNGSIVKQDSGELNPDVSNEELKKQMNLKRDLQIRMDESRIAEKEIEGHQENVDCLGLQYEVYAGQNDEELVKEQFQCDICTKVFNTRHAVKRHRTCHEERERSHICPLCNQGFFKKSHLAGHMATHTDGKRFPCDMCGIYFALQRYLREHMRRTHNMVPTKPNKNVKDIHRHKLATHINEKRYTCEYCRKKFKTKEKMRHHIQDLHSADELLKIHKCSFCGKAFRTKSRMLAHMRWHTNDRQFPCDICGKTFVQNSCLKKHRAIHFDEKQHKCEVCGKGFNQKYSLKTHMKVHMNVE